jgi:hypothetical protein
MAWRPHQYLIEGELDNTEPNHVRGWLRFHGLSEAVLLDLAGDFHRDIRGARIHLKGLDGPAPADARQHMKTFAAEQTGKVGDITAGRPPRDYVSYPYVEWYSEENGRVVLELLPEQVEVLGTPIPWETCAPVSREAQTRNMFEFLTGVACTPVKAGVRHPVQ